MVMGTLGLFAVKSYPYNTHVVLKTSLSELDSCNSWC